MPARLVARSCARDIKFVTLVHATTLSKLFYPSKRSKLGGYPRLSYVLTVMFSSPHERNQKEKQASSAVLRQKATAQPVFPWLRSKSERKELDLRWGIDSGRELCQFTGTVSPQTISSKKADS